MNLSLKGNWVDLVIILIFIYFLTDALRFGFWLVLANFFSFLLSLTVAFLGYSSISFLLQDNFSLSRPLSNALGFLFLAGFSEFILNYIFYDIANKIPFKFWKKPWNNILAIIPALGQGIIISTFLLVLVVCFPVFPKVKKDVNESRFGTLILKNTAQLEARVDDIFGELISNSLTHLTIQPGSRESISLQIIDFDLSEDKNSEELMFMRINEERKKRNLSEFSLREELVFVAREYAKDMWERGYFGHFSPEGEDVAARLNKANILFNVVGENLALAPSVEIAHAGLMNSEGHRRNILDPEFKKVGVGAIDNGVYGKMFVQIFTD